jgi:hypothetical protein
MTNNDGGPKPRRPGPENEKVSWRLCSRALVSVLSRPGLGGNTLGKQLI